MPEPYIACPHIDYLDQIADHIQLILLHILRNSQEMLKEEYTKYHQYPIQEDDLKQKKTQTKYKVHELYAGTYPISSTISLALVMILAPV